MGRRSKYFDGSVSNRKSKFCFVGYATKQWDTMHKFMSSRNLVELQDCELKLARRGAKLENNEVKYQDRTVNEDI